MLTNEDVQKLKEAFATKDEIREMISPLATKKEMDNLSVKLLPREEFENFRVELKEDIDGLREMVQALVISVDKLVGAVGTLSQEYTMVTNKVDRHEKWLLQIAEKLGIKLQY